MTENIAEEMLRILPNDRAWTKGQMVAGKRRCLAGARLRIDGPTTSMCLNYDPYTQLVAQIITDQYPERTIAYVRPIDKIVFFNDHPDTRFADVRLVLEKAAVEWEEIHGG